jgi:hypothetical protein
MPRLTAIPQTFSPSEGDGYNDPASYILNFLEELPDKIELFFDEGSSDLHEWSSENGVIEFFSPSIIRDSFEAARRRLLESIENRRNQYEVNKQQKEIDYSYLDFAGFTDTSLELKMNAINYR